MDSDLIKDVKKYLRKNKVSIPREKGKRKKDEKHGEVELDKLTFVKTLFNFFSTLAIKELLKKRKAEVLLFAHYDSSMGAAITGSGPSYSLIVSGKGLIVNWGRRAKPEKIPWRLDAWLETIPYGDLFHDSSSGDYEFRPEITSFMEGVERDIKKLIQ